MKIKLFYIFVLLLITPFSTTASKEVMHWLVHDMPPAWIISGEYKNRGIVDFQRRAYISTLSEYKHIKMVGTQSRLYALLKSRDGNTYCNGGQLLTDEIKSFVISSFPVDKIMPNHIITTKEKLKKMKLLNGVVSLKTLLQNKELVLGYVKSRPYGGTVNKVVNSFKKNSNVHFFSYNKLHNLPALLDQSRVDYFFEYPFMVKYYQLVNKVKSDFVSVRMIENSDFYNYYVVCNKTEAGRNVIEKINTLLNSNRKKTIFYDGWNLWLPSYLKDKYKVSNSSKK